ncbi:hypothetical protein TWF679_009097 [Orbilia oligospora]|uniref:N-acetyltransferase domain-containing protein n=1 Tax=Orbilia oligospora TaxID=2813651 RepID=A0A8H8V3L0_ORBOL|nr:hypothetical protein TWF679_009097 [Orbilia oligospora]
MAHRSRHFIGPLRQMPPRRLQSTISSVKTCSQYSPQLGLSSNSTHRPTLHNTQIYGYNPVILHSPPLDFTVRPATALDASALTSLWFNVLTLTSSSPSLATISWWNKVWTLGISFSPHLIQTYVVTHNPTTRIVAFSRWQLPNQHSAQNTYLPDFPPEWDACLTEALWGGISKTKAEAMGNRPHWMGEFLAIRPEYKGQGLGSMLVNWGCKQADAAGLEIYGDTTVENRKFFGRKFGFEDYISLDMPRKGDGVVGIVRKPAYTK